MTTKDINRSLLALMGALAIGGCAGGEITPGGDLEPEIQSLPRLPSTRLCEELRPGDDVVCHARVRTDGNGIHATANAPFGFGPSDLQGAYKIDASGGADKVIAIVDAYDNPSAETDLATYRAQYGLPACTTANGCFRKVNQNGVQGSYPTADAGWSGEIALDVDMASAVCPKCKILLVEANSASFNDLGASVNTAVKLGATVVSNSYGAGDQSAWQSLDSSYYNHPGVAIFASAGDGGYGVEYPAASPHVVAVGGTTLARSSSNGRGWVESVWGSTAKGAGGTGSGCSAYVTKPSWQKDTGCGKRTVADVSAVADPSSGVAVFNAGKWLVYGGTSASSPIVAGIYALTGHGNDDGSYAYGHTSAFFDVTTGANGACGNYLCQGAAGFDGPTGNGTPNATALAGGSTGGGGIGTGYYTVVNQTSKLCLDVNGNGTANGTALIQWNCHGGANQSWKLIPTDSGYYQIVSRSTPLVWDVKDVSTATGAQVWLWSYVGGANQQWQPISVSNGVYKFVSRNSGKCLDVPGSSTTAGTNLQQWDCNGTGAQSFALNPTN